MSDSEYYGERILLYADTEIAMFASPSSLKFLSKSKQIFADGTFRYAPRGSYQVYRVFGLSKKNHCCPFLTVLMTGKTKKMYSRIWKKLCEHLPRVPSWKQANFDAEAAAYSSFAKVFPNCNVKLCLFHTKQALDRHIKQLGLLLLYRTNQNVQEIIKKIGAVQMVPSSEWRNCLELIKSDIELQSGEIQEKLLRVFEYYRTTWLSKGEKLFSHFDTKLYRTTNHCESYHAKQSFYYVPNGALGQWVVHFRELSNAEEAHCYDVRNGRVTVPSNRYKNERLNQVSFSRSGILPCDSIGQGDVRKF